MLGVGARDAEEGRVMMRRLDAKDCEGVEATLNAMFWGDIRIIRQREEAGTVLEMRSCATVGAIYHVVGRGRSEDLPASPAELERHYSGDSQLGEHAVDGTRQGHRPGHRGAAGSQRTAETDECTPRRKATYPSHSRRRFTNAFKQRRNDDQRNPNGSRTDDAALAGGTWRQPTHDRSSLRAAAECDRHGRTKNAALRDEGIARR